MKRTFLKKLFFIVTAMLISQCGFSQKMKVTYDDDTIKVDGVPYAIMTKKSAGVLIYDYSVRNMSGTELIFFKVLLRDTYGTRTYTAYGQGQEIYYEINFIASGGKAEMDHKSGKGLAKMVVENNLIKNNAIDYEAERRFMQVYHGHYPSSEAPVSNNSAPVVVNINNAPPQASTEQIAPPPAPPKSKSPVTINGNEIIRDNNVIGKFREETTSSTYSEKQLLITVYSEAGDKIAEASAPVASPKEWYIKTFSDGKNFSILYDSPGEREKLFRYLADKNYFQ
jgi:hypothetical protein